MAAIDQIRKMYRSFNSSTMLMKIIWINIGIFVSLRLAAIVCLFAGNPNFINTIISYVQLPSNLTTLAMRPWTLVTYMFAQYDVLHIVFNLLWFYWFGTLFMMISTQRQMLALYLLGGLGGGALFLLCYATLPTFGGHTAMLIGSSASVMAIVTATAILMPDFKMNLLLIGPVSLKWIAIATIGLVLIGVTGSNGGGEIAHMGGIIAGATYALQLKRGCDITRPINQLIDQIVNLFNRTFSSIQNFFTSNRKQNNNPQQTSKNQASGTNRFDNHDREELDAILDKIKKSGYSALTPEECQRLFDVSKKI